MARVGQCTSCHRPVIWVVNAKTGNRLPLDADPDRPGKALRVANGNIVFTGDRYEDGTWLVRTLASADKAAAGPDRFRSHFASCPQAHVHRRQKRAAQ